MSKQVNIETPQKMAEAANQGKLEILREVFAPDVLDHDPAPDQGPGPEGYISFFTNLREAFPDLKVAPEEMVADEEKIAIAYTITGIHKGNFAGISPTGRKIKARGMQIAKFNSAGKIVERWGSSDELGILKQIGRSEGRLIHSSNASNHRQDCVAQERIVRRGISCARTRPTPQGPA